MRLLLHFLDLQLVQIIPTEGLTCLRLPTLLHRPPHPLPPTHTLICATRDITEVVDKLAQNLAGQLAETVIKHQLKDCSSCTVYLVWLQSSTRKSQWFQYLKVIFFEIPKLINVTIQSVFQYQVTYMFSIEMHGDFSIPYVGSLQAGDTQLCTCNSTTAPCRFTS